MRFKENTKRIEELVDQVARSEAQLAALRDLNSANSHRLTRLSRELINRKDKQDVQSVLEERLDQTFGEVSDLAEQLLERSNRLLELEAEIKAARLQLTNLGSQLNHQIQQRKVLETRINNLEAKREENSTRKIRIGNSISAALDLLSARANGRDARAGRAATEVEETVIELLVAALGENQPE